MHGFDAAGQGSPQGLDSEGSAAVAAGARSERAGAQGAGRGASQGARGGGDRAATPEDPDSACSNCRPPFRYRRATAIPCAPRNFTIASHGTAWRIAVFESQLLWSATIAPRVLKSGLPECPQ